ncbi:MAG: hypothetical protein CM15mP66_03000 [Pseudomonadota bacterium]|nr:MAG: hypothetical protein CM15mP66_03000 [Pseudomonadota bacterium]
MFCGTFDAKGAKFETGHGQLSITRPGQIRKFVEKVDQITFSGKQARFQNQQVLYVTERAVFRLQEKELELLEIAPGIDLQKDILDQMDFLPSFGKLENHGRFDFHGRPKWIRHDWP